MSFILSMAPLTGNPVVILPYMIESLFCMLDKVPGRDFTIVRQEKRGDGTSIKISNPNSSLVRNVVGIFKKGTEEDDQYSNDQGDIHSNLTDCDSVFVIHTLFPDIPDAS